jgi:hypothetical protein
LWLVCVGENYAKYDESCSQASQKGAGLYSSERKESQWLFKQARSIDALIKTVAVRLK